MKTPKELLGRVFSEIGGASIREGLSVQQQMAARDGMPPEFQLVIKLEAEGGECPRCGKPWKKVSVSNTFAIFDYYTPDCECWSRCTPSLSRVWRIIKDRQNKDRTKMVMTNRFVQRGCGCSKHREDATGITRCLSCGYDPQREKIDAENASERTRSIKGYRESLNV